MAAHAREDVDDSILAGMADGDFDAFAELYRRHAPAVFKFVRAQVRDDATAEDVTAQTFFKAWTSSNRFRGEGTYAAWLMRIAQSSIASWYAQRGRTVVLEEPPEEEDPSPGPAAVVLDGEERKRVRQVVAELPGDQRRAVTLRYLLELPVVEIAKLMGKTEGAVRILLHRARARLRRLLEREKEGR